MAFFGHNLITSLNPSWNGEEEQEGNNGGALNHGTFDLQTTNILPVLPQQISPHDSVQQGSGSGLLPVLGLNLIKTESLQKRMFIMQSDVTDRQNPDSLPQQAPEKLKALNFHFSQIIIGDWKLESSNEGDLIAKCYFAKKKLVWEILESTTRNGAAERVKSKFEIQWSEVLSLSASFHDNQPSELNVELSHRPTFYLETNPQPKRHTQWKFTSDFTGGSASCWRRHKLRFAPGVLEKHYEKLVRSDTHLYHCSQVPFPSLASPYFDYDNEDDTFHYGPMNITNHHHDIRHYRVLPVSPQGYFPMHGGGNSNQTQFLVQSGSQILIQGQSQENAANALLGTQANPLLDDGIHDTRTREVLLGRRVNTLVQDGSQRNMTDADALPGVQMMNSFVRDGLLEKQENSLVQEANQENAKRQRTEAEGNFQVSVIPETSVMPPQQVEGDLHDNAIQNAFANTEDILDTIPGWDFGSTYNTDIAGVHGEDGFVGTLTGDIDPMSYGMNTSHTDHSFLNFDPSNQFGDDDHNKNIVLWPDLEDVGM